jgi:copper homeostasis protein
MLLEVCTSNYQSAHNAQEAGADRIELCSELAVGGITPSFGLLKEVLGTLDIQVFVLIRPRSGDFTYSEIEFEIMKKDIQLSKDLGAAGIVSGVLKADNTIDLSRTKELVDHSRPLPFTFHRAFDWIPDPVKAIQQLIDLGVDRVLTSGQAANSQSGIDLLIILKNTAQGKIRILPGGGINASNAKLFKRHGFSEIHASAWTSKGTIDTPRISMNSAELLSDDHIFYSDKSKLQAILNVIKE